jgi:hypothetical protein
MTTMTIGILGTGRMALRLATLFADRGHAVTLGSRAPARARALARAMRRPEITGGFSWRMRRSTPRAGDRRRVPADPEVCTRGRLGTSSNAVRTALRSGFRIPGSGFRVQGSGVTNCRDNPRAHLDRGAPRPEPCALGAEPWRLD